jgi:hypothetical protein
MFTKSQYFVESNLISDANKEIPNIDFRLTLNNPTGDFFYDAWEIKAEFKDTVWDKILKVLPGPIGEARLIKLQPGNCYRSHSDIDDRWHLAISGSKSIFLDLDNDKVFPNHIDLFWYSIDTSFRHSAANVGHDDRIQLVVRKLLKKPVSVGFKNIIIIADDNVKARYIFDDTISPWLNKECKLGNIDQFQIVNEKQVSFKLAEFKVSELLNTCPSSFRINYES